MSMHKKPLTELERSGLEAHGLPIGTPSQCADSFRLGAAWAQQRITELERYNLGLASESCAQQERIAQLEADADTLRCQAKESES